MSWWLRAQTQNYLDSDCILVNFGMYNPYKISISLI